MWTVFVAAREGFLRPGEHAAPPPQRLWLPGNAWRGGAFRREDAHPVHADGRFIGISVDLYNSKNNKGSRTPQSALFPSRPEDKELSVPHLLQRLRGHPDFPPSSGPCAPLLPLQDGTPYTQRWLLARLRSLLTRARVPKSASYTLHSFRAGGTTDAFTAGVPLAVVKTLGRWRSDAVLVYYRPSTAAAMEALRGVSVAPPRSGSGF